MEHDPAVVVAGTGPSAHAAGRYGLEVAREVADLRVRLREAVMRSEVFLEAGRPDAAARVVAEQRAAVAALRDRLAASTRRAAVEAEAERILAGAPGFDQFAGLPRDRAREDVSTGGIMRPTRPTPRRSPSHDHAGLLRRLPAAAAAAALSLAAAGLVLVSATPGGQRAINAARAGVESLVPGGTSKAAASTAAAPPQSVRSTPSIGTGLLRLFSRFERPSATPQGPAARPEFPGVARIVDGLVGLTSAAVDELADFVPGWSRRPDDEPRDADGADSDEQEPDERGDGTRRAPSSEQSQAPIGDDVTVPISGSDLPVAPDGDH